MTTTVATPVLPPELERVVFELAAWRDKETMCTLVLVARRVNIWIGPLRYRVRLVTFQSGNIDALWQLIDNCPASRIHTRHLAVCRLTLHTEDDIATSSIPRILRAFPHLVSLRLWSVTPASIADFHLLHALPALRRLAINLVAIFSERTPGPDPPPAPLLHVTHLELFHQRAHFHGDVPDLNLMRSALRCWPALTVLAHVHGPFVERLDGAQQALHAERAAEFAAIDPRLVILRSVLESWEQDWERGAWGGWDCWRRAEEVVAARGLRNSN
ncbi:hypothetical protein MIND_00582900 [Mycena indigotica]|uniref:Uncharacterized protein n=1 Tax=Mycena indigotica TaxID=2126181 RepID=A0A8H6SSF0_9AGAR|nr:uncharacterized protein MIND_00582900 [Mycena indigotica]KAF7303537.1 hypothetical protein MIND_00582900 [Mycena indigotica]